MADRLCLCGGAGVGKSALAGVLVRDYGYEVVKFADPLKDMLRVLGLGDRELEGDLKEEPSGLLCGRSPRWAMQRLGTEWGRELMGQDLWVEAWRRRVAAMRTPLLVVDDCRFPNELAAARAMGFVPVRISRGEDVPWREPGEHISESALDAVWMPEMVNNGSLEVLALQMLGL